MKLTLVHDKIGGSSGMGRVVGWMVRTALANDIDLTLIASEIDDDLRPGARFLQVPGMRRLPSGAWKLAWGELALRAVRHGGNGVIHVHQPMLLREADLMTCHHLAPSARARGHREIGSGVEHALRESQALAVRKLDDRCYTKRPTKTRMHFGSELMRSEFCNRYGVPDVSTVLAPPSPHYHPVSKEERSSARDNLKLTGGGIVVGYLGGFDLRKGLTAVETLLTAADLKLVVGGPQCDRLDWSGAIVVGYVDPERVLAACDVLVAPSIFDAGPVVVLQAVARGIPVVVSDAVGLATDVQRTGAGVVWAPGQDLADAVRAAASSPREACAAMVEQLSENRQSQKLIELWSECEEEIARR